MDLIWIFGTSRLKLVCVLIKDPGHWGTYGSRGSSPNPGGVATAAPLLSFSRSLPLFLSRSVRVRACACLSVYICECVRERRLLYFFSPPDMWKHGKNVSWCVSNTSTAHKLLQQNRNPRTEYLTWDACLNLQEVKLPSFRAIWCLMDYVHQNKWTRTIKKQISNWILSVAWNLKSCVFFHN